MSETPTTKQELIALVDKEEADLGAAWKQVGEERVAQPGAMGDWSFKDEVAHLTAWRRWSLARLDAARDGGEPASLWPSTINGEDVDAINNWFYQQSKNTSPEAILSESRQSFERLREGIQQLSDDVLFTPGHFPWMKGKALGPAIVSSSVDHFYEEHESGIREWISQL